MVNREVGRYGNEEKLENEYYGYVDWNGYERWRKMVLSTE